MEAESSMKRKWRALARQYQAGLRRYLKQGPVASLQPAVRLGNRAVALGLGTLDLALLHEQALIGLALPVRTAADRERIIRRAGAFFAEASLPMEDTHRSALEANAHLSRLNRTLSRRTVELAASNRKLKKEKAAPFKR